MKINATKSANIMPSKASSSQGKGNTPTTQKIPTEAAKTNQCGDSPKPLKTNMSVEDMIKLVLAMEAMQKANEITQEVIQKYLGSSD